MAFTAELDQPLRVIGRDGIIRYACMYCIVNKPEEMLTGEAFFEDAAEWANHVIEAHGGVGG